MSAQKLTPDDVKRLALEAIPENPQIVMEAVAILQKQQEDAARVAVTDVLSDQRVTLEQDPNAPVIRNPVGDVIPDSQSAIPLLGHPQIAPLHTQQNN